MESSEVIPVETKVIKFITPATEARLSHLFDTYDWSIETFNKYYCLQHKCNDNMICREDMLPFTLSNHATTSEFDGKSHKYTYSNRKNMRAFCALANGCYIMALSLVLDELKKFEVFSVGRQTKLSKNFELPPGCYLDHYEKPETVGMDGMFYLENKESGGWFCHSNLYLHYPLPHTLGDLKIGRNGEINFVSIFAVLLTPG
ncbi:unnamed protein product [Euphydryas editha]|uniref:Uncharacterized protein n=1 Tax=Euphydryas editha TaxID=104508 RepID=A0AAU9TNY9_EUPED|nr:unnamed protein product [Euphydryas editha]